MQQSSSLLTNKIFQNIIDAVPALIFWTDKNHIIVANNLQHATAFGFSSPDQLVGKPMSYEFEKVGFDNNLIDKIYKDHNEIIQLKKGKAIEYTGKLFNEEGIKKQSTFLSYKYPLFDENNKVIGIIGVSIDITELKKTQQQLLESQERFKSIFQKIIDMLPVLLFWTDKNHCYSGNNLTHAKAFGYNTSEELIGISLTDMFKHANVSNDFIERSYKAHNHLLHSRKTQVFD